MTTRASADDRAAPGIEVSAAGLGRGVLWSYSDTVTGIAAEVALLAYGFRRIGASDFGLFAVASTATAVLAAIDFGLGASVIRAAAREQVLEGEDRDSARADLSAAHATYVAFGGVVLLGTAALVALLPLVINVPPGRGPAFRLTSALVGTSIAITLASAALVSLAAGRRRFRLAAGASMSANLVSVILTMLLINPFGLVALGLGRVVGAVLQAAILFLFLRPSNSWLKLMPTWPGAQSFRRISRFALPLLIISAGGQLVAATDLIVIGAVATAATAGLFRAGTAIPGRASQLLFAGFDVGFPFIAGSRSHEEQESLLRWVSTLFSYLAGAGFCLLALERKEVILLLTGTDSQLAQQVVMIFCAVWVVNIPAHGLTLVLIARARHSVFLPLVVVELTTNIVLTVVLVSVDGPRGAALATLLTITVADYLVLPWLVRREFTRSIWRLIFLDSLLPTCLGALVAVGAFTFALVAGDPVLRLMIAGLVTGLVSAAIAPLMLGTEGRRWVRGAMLKDLLGHPAP